jgi:hypothetical protein
LISQQDTDVQTTAAAAKQFRCAQTGHDGSDPSKWAPSVLTSEEEYKEYMQSRRKPGEISSSMSAAEDPLRHEFVCYVFRNTAADSRSRLGFGIHLENERQGTLSSEFEWLSHDAFMSGTRHSTTNKPFEYWLPIHITDAGWDQKLFLQSVQDIAKAVNQRVDSDYAVAHAVLHICASLMTSALVTICKNAEQQTANDRFIKGFFALYRLMHRVSDTNPHLMKIASKHCCEFIEQPHMRNKSNCPNLGSLLVSVIMSPAHSWQDLAQAFQEENDARNFFWYAVGTPTSPATLRRFLADPNQVQGRSQAVFRAIETSRMLVLFQVRFCTAAKSLSRANLDARFGLPPEELCLHLKQTHTEALKVQDWGAYFDWVSLPRVSEHERDMQLVEAQARSLAQGYHRVGSSAHHSHSGSYFSSNHGGGRGYSRGRGRGGNFGY